VRGIIKTRQFKRDFKKIAVSGRYLLDDFIEVIELLVDDNPLPFANIVIIF
jgi:mRNA-degrading endonuclease YafQ of YafQ-DinJ toxin-antitoxin module